MSNAFYAVLVLYEWARRFCGFRSSASYGSNVRRFLTRMTVVVSLIIVIEMRYPLDVDAIDPFTFRFAVTWSFVYLTVVVIIPVLLLTKALRVLPETLRII